MKNRSDFYLGHPKKKNLINIILYLVVDILINSLLYFY